MGESQVPQGDVKILISGKEREMTGRQLTISSVKLLESVLICGL